MNIYLLNANYVFVLFQKINEMKIIKSRKSFKDFLIENQNKNLIFKVGKYDGSELWIVNEIDKINFKVFNFFFPNIPKEELDTSFRINFCLIENNPLEKDSYEFKGHWIDFNKYGPNSIVDYHDLIKKYNFDEDN